MILLGAPQLMHVGGKFYMGLLFSIQMNFVAIIGVDEYCMADAGEIDLLVEFKDMNLRVNQTFLKAINSFISVVVRAPSLILMQERVNIENM